jgi:hypothetical protein
MMPESHYPKAFARQNIRTLPIPFCLYCMLIAINFHYQLLLQAAEVYYVRPDKVLASKFRCTQSSVAQTAP